MRSASKPNTGKRRPPGTSNAASDEKMLEGDASEAYRVFISYSRVDRAIADRIARHLESIGLRALWDKRLVGGEGFTEQIKNLIAHAHVFLSIVTPVSAERGWVHQELGFAHALNIPVLPVLINQAPTGMVSMIQGVHLRRSTPDLDAALPRSLIEHIVAQSRDQHMPLYECAPDVVSRARLLAEYANRISAIGVRDVIRQKGALTSFNILDRHAGHPLWEKRYSDRPPGKNHYQALRRERIALERHARAAGCRLIINVYTLKRGDLSSESRLIRLHTLIRFLESISGNTNVSAVVIEDADPGESLTLVGDWFSAESITRRGPLSTSYLQTIFTRHAPTVREHLEAFDEEFAEHLHRAKLKHGTASRERALSALRKTARCIEQQMRARSSKGQ